mmetsp:Transcript_12114/g.24133  ORF Transcript_12114/g.24133 Transcript_12114/m.24133 type:complete len:223 (-) Transcript_12114:174-842(-)|eukprot:CAMPEP_0181314750 /NCGR_PEP_ID=MMETSP1101-20121128/14989_1 /TAXON_ID=46948 /ORGANISM="Rhodomonas abbreviata, Strain Caron Lab Isolate" /LENGTH=222 /DNA_ID=CAMNT_0023421873 /DNA_START=78 /DNA_END=746 /DNA_ORIENTATION=-
MDALLKKREKSAGDAAFDDLMDLTRFGSDSLSSIQPSIRAVCNIVKVPVTINDDETIPAGANASYDAVGRRLKVCNRTNDTPEQFARAVCHELIHHIDATEEGIVKTLMTEAERKGMFTSVEWHLARCLTELNAHVVQGKYGGAQIERGKASLLVIKDIRAKEFSTAKEKTKEIVRSYHKFFEENTQTKIDESAVLDMYDERFPSEQGAFFERLLSYDAATS